MTAAWEGCRRKKLLLYFNGWAMNEAAVAHLALPADTDLIICQDYRTLDIGDLPEISQYEHITIVAWSMGVWAVERCAALHRLPRIDHAVAWAGTTIPMHDTYGIPDAIFRGTMSGLNEENRERFNRRMCGGKRLKHLFEALQKRSTEEVRDELMAVYTDMMQERSVLKDPCIPETLIPWQKAYIPMHDKIIPPLNQVKYWTGQSVSTIKLPAAEHYMMQGYTRWIDLL